VALGFEHGITTFLERRRDVFGEVNVEGSFGERIKDLQNRMNAQSNHKPVVVISGAGPAGLLRAVQSISNGNPTRVIEKRSEDAVGLMNTVALTKHTIVMLQYCGIYQYLRENKLIYPPNSSGYISVRLADLRDAMKAVSRALGVHAVIQYDSTIIAVDEQSDKIKLVVQSLNETKSTEEVDIFVNAEGSHSTTNGLLGIRRTEVLPHIPVIAAIYRDNRPKIRGICSLLKYVVKSFIYVATTIYHHVIFIFRFLLSKRFRWQFTGALILKTPNQNYVGCGYSDEINKQLLSLEKVVKEKKEALKNAQIDPEELKIAEEEYNTFAKRWVNYSICFANLVALTQCFGKGPHLSMGGHLSFDKFTVIHIGADHANEYCKSIKKTAVLLAGDASATVDPTTGLGCNTAIQSSVDFLDFIWDYDAGVDSERLLRNYSSRMQERISYIHDKSREARILFRPDALVPRSMFMNMN